MSDLRVEVVSIDKVENHPNADRLDLATIKGWQCIVQRDEYRSGDKVLYIPIDSILPPTVESLLFEPDSKIKLTKSRVKTIKLRGAISQGMLAPLELLGLDSNTPVGTDCKDTLGIKKWEPPVSGNPLIKGQEGKAYRPPNTNFLKYADVQNFKNYNKTFSNTIIGENGEPENEEVNVDEKVHGTNFRAGWVLKDPQTWWAKLKSRLPFYKRYEFTYGSHNREMEPHRPWKKHWDKNVYAEIVMKYDLEKVLSHGEVIYGEIYGYKIQKHYEYGCTEAERKLVIFDLQVNGTYVDCEQLDAFCEQTGLPRAKVVYRGKFDLEKIKEIANGDSIMEPKQKVMEGVVIRSIKEENSYFGRKILKLISDRYLLKEKPDSTEWH